MFYRRKEETKLFFCRCLGFVIIKFCLSICLIGRKFCSVNEDLYWEVKRIARKVGEEKETFRAKDICIKANCAERSRMIDTKFRRFFTLLFGFIEKDLRYLMNEFVFRIFLCRRKFPRISQIFKRIKSEIEKVSWWPNKYTKSFRR